MQQTIVVLTDDLDGDDIPQGKGRTIQFGLDGQNYEIDLNDKNVKGLVDLFDRYISAGRKVKLNGHQPPRRQRPRRDTPNIVSAATRMREQLANRHPAPPPEEPRYSSQSAAYDTAIGTFDPKAVRAWAEANGIPVSRRGRVQESVVLKFKEAGN